MQHRPVLRRIRNISISIGTLLVIFVGIGVAYTFYMSQTDTAPVVSKPESTLRPNTVKHAKLADNVPANASVQSLTTPVMPGDNASMSVKGNPGSTCSIKVEYNKVASADSGLIAKPTNEFGIVTWAWTLGATTPEGKWPVTVTCEYNKKTAIVIGDLVVSKIAPKE